MKKSLLLFVLALAGANLFSQSLSGKISYQYISGNTYRVTIEIYSMGAENCEIAVSFGDGDSVMVPRINGPISSTCPALHDGQLSLSCINNTKLSIYSIAHTFPGNGTYSISAWVPGRDASIQNLMNPENTEFYLEAELQINPFLGINNSSYYTASTLIVCGCMNSSLIFNPALSDPDGDSLYYENSLSGYPGYSFPAVSPVFQIDDLTGNLNWSYPNSMGHYVYGFKVSEWKLIGGSRYFTGSSMLEMLIRINVCTGIEEHAKASVLAVFPNPASTEISFSFNEITGKVYFISISNALGQLVKKIQMTEATQKIDIRDLPAGIYFYALTDGNVLSDNGKIILSGNSIK